MMKRIGLVILIAVIALAVSGMAVGRTIPAAQQAKDRTAAPENSPVIDENWELLPRPYYVASDSPALKALFGVNHEFNGAFSTGLGSVELGLLRALGVNTEPVQIYQITGKPVCGDNVCQGRESRTCPEDCSQEPPSEPERLCVPDNQIPWGINKVNSGSGGAGVTVAVLDTGVDTNHMDLKSNIKDCATKVTHFKRDAKNCEDKHGHGTHVSGTVLANAGSDGLGVYGAAPEAGLAAVKVCDRRGYCYGDDMAAGIYYAADSGANIISMSIGGDLPDPQVLSAIDYAAAKDVLVVAAAGNDGPADSSIDYPGAYVKVVAVSAIDSTEAVPDWSSRGINDGDYITEEREVELAGPGVLIESTYNNGCYAYMSGTSMAAPHISGLAAKLWQGNAATTKSYLHSIARDIWEIGDDTATGIGLPTAP